MGERSRGKRRGLSCRNAGHLGEEGRESQATHSVAGRPIAGANGIGLGHVFAAFSLAVMAAVGVVVVAGRGIDPNHRRGGARCGRLLTRLGSGANGRLLRWRSRNGRAGESDHGETGH